jgi:hypothetical protein
MNILAPEDVTLHMSPNNQNSDLAKGSNDFDYIHK